MLDSVLEVRRVQLSCMAPISVIMEGATPTFMPDCDVVVIADWCGKRLDQRELLGLQDLCWRPPRT